MARREITQITDDFDGSILSENEVHVIRFSVDGSSYVMDVSKKNRELFEQCIADFIPKARKDSSPAGATAKYDAKKVREWAQARGLHVAERGKISQEIISDYLAAHGGV
ncbi:Lsr2 family protein [Corynebacterium sp. ES2794-CONJ1]|uniref:histone-like nucleoid-structuring protein Lsr2 n=1 Tax=unclassified Corynebacterium TaxID=2624378 RepID=UPI002168E969|nr:MULTISPECIES: Lsr2 family protein [unclassified Corynebacterium]MCS4490081.1 Lsr2 family protein [Corynebacterium sp. ES2775-CONJ]MCS4492569.1 Lsr2 family protein [Corynebacterium sp. ES2715-CONJ3]MCS4532218.1 Lsr2 family protein [Corynebacterium sp. ES2730-CONJ]MCU9519614.1 Lsr2 family protein [Corynebacterium sp. ES2794-CONJ1]